MSESGAHRTSGRLTYAVGDVHGRLDLLRQAVDAIAEHTNSHDFRVVFLGDYVDRGPDARGVVEFLIDLQRRWQVVCLKGNHDDLMSRALTNPGNGDVARWFSYGGRNTLRSYGAKSIDEAAGAIPPAHIRWLTGLPITTGDRHRIYVHAGLLPGSPVHRQKEETCLWIRESFLRGGPDDFEAHIVHGHTPVWAGKRSAAEPELLEHRTNLDSGAFATGVLTVGVFDESIPGGPVSLLRVVGVPMPHLMRDHNAAESI